MSENRLKPVSIDSESDVKETTFSESFVSAATKGQLNDAKMEKKVTFARLLSKVSAEISSGSEVKTINYTQKNIFFFGDEIILKFIEAKSTVSRLM